MDDDSSDYADDEDEPQTTPSRQKLLRRPQDRQRAPPPPLPQDRPRSRSPMHFEYVSLIPSSATPPSSDVEYGANPETSTVSPPVSEAESALGALGPGSTPPPIYRALSTEEGLTSESDGGLVTSANEWFDEEDDRGSDVDPMGTNPELRELLQKRTERVVTYPRGVYEGEERRRYVDTSDSEVERIPGESEEEYRIRKQHAINFLFRLGTYTDEEKRSLFSLKICLKKMSQNAKMLFYDLTRAPELDTTSIGIPQKVNSLVDTLYDETLLQCFEASHNSPEQTQLWAYINRMAYVAFTKLNKMFDPRTQYMLFIFHDGSDFVKCRFKLRAGSIVLRLFEFLIDWLMIWATATGERDITFVRQRRDELKIKRDRLLEYLVSISRLPSDPILELPQPSEELGATAARSRETDDRRVTMDRYSERRYIKWYHKRGVSPRKATKRY